MHKLKSYREGLARISQIFISAFFPLKCLACGELIPPDPPVKSYRGLDGGQQTGGYGSIETLFDNEMKPYLCPSCMDGYVPMTSPICTRCGKSFKSPEGQDRICATCLTGKTTHIIRKTRSVGVYDTSFMALVRALKYQGKVRLARPFGRLLREVYGQYWMPQEIDIIIPVPLHPKRVRERGFNQSWLMVKDWPEFNGAAQDIMIRKKPTQPQIGLSPGQREDNIKGAFDVLQPNIVASKRIMVVDDVYTTGSTLNECAKVLLNAGAVEVDALTLARAV